MKCFPCTIGLATLILFIGGVVGYQYGVSNTQSSVTPSLPITPTSTTIDASLYSVDLGNTPASQTITMPVDSTGAAILVGSTSGTMYFEGDFFVELKDVNGNIVTTGIATAQSSWMTVQQVPFVLTFENIPLQLGTGTTLEFHKSNPSGEPQNDLSYVYSVNVVYIP